MVPRKDVTYSRSYRVSTWNITHNSSTHRGTCMYTHIHMHDPKLHQHSFSTTLSLWHHHLSLKLCCPFCRTFLRELERGGVLNLPNHWQLQFLWTEPRSIGSRLSTNLCGALGCQNKLWSTCHWNKPTPCSSSGKAPRQVVCGWDTAAFGTVMGVVLQPAWPNSVYVSRQAQWSHWGCWAKLSIKPGQVSKCLVPRLDVWSSED